MTGSAADGFSRRAKALENFHHDALKKHGANLRRKLLQSAKDATGGDRALSGLGSTPKLGITLRTAKGNATSSVTLKPSPKAARGPWVWMDQGTRPGMRAKRRSARVGRSRRDSQVTGFGSYRHPGTKGKNAWFGVTDRELPLIAKELQRRFDVSSR
jgi:hypothetical protein